MKESTYRERTTESIREAYDNANRLIEEKALGEAEETLHAVVDAEPGFAPAYNRLGVIAIRRGRRDDAFDWFQAAIEADDTYAPALTNLGNMSLEAGNRAEARGYYGRAIDCDQEYGPAHNSLGVLLRQEGRHSEAVRHLRIARRQRAYHVEYQELSSPGGRRGCLLVVGFVVAMLAGAIILFLRF